MTDNRTTELETIIEALTELASAITWTVPNSASSVESHLKNAWATIDELNATLSGGGCAKCAEDMGVYADSLCDTIKERLDELLRCLETDWHISVSWDGLRKFWCIELTEEGIRIHDAMLTAEQVHDAYLENFEKAHETSYDLWEPSRFDWQAIADELNAALGGGECKIIGSSTNNLMYPDYMTKWYELSCGHSVTLKGSEPPNFCPNCGKKVKQ